MAHLILKTKRGPLGPSDRDTRLDLVPGKSLAYYVPQKFWQADTVLIKHNGHEIKDVLDLFDIFPAHGDKLELIPVAGIASALILGAVNALISIGIGVGMYQWESFTKQRQERERARAEVGKSYALDVMGNQVEEGAVLPVVQGTHRCGGVAIQQYTTEFEEGIDQINTLLAVSEGPINSIGVAHIDGNVLTNYRNGTLTYVPGTLNQSSIPNFRRTTTANAYNTQLTQNSAVTIAGTTAGDMAKIKVTFISGLYYQRDNGDLEWARFEYRYRVRESAGPGAWGDWAYSYFAHKRTTAFSIYFDVTYPANGTYDIQLEKRSANHDSAIGRISDAYLKEHQEIAYDDLIYPGVALAGITAVGSDQLNGQPGRYTVLTNGTIVQRMSSATAVSEAAHTRNPADLMLGMLYNREWGLGTAIDSTLWLTMSGGAGNYSAGEIVTGPASNYQFRGKVISWTAGTLSLVVESLQGLPHGTITGADSGAARTCSTIDEAAAVDLTAQYAYKTFCDEYVPDGTGDGSTVDQDSAAAANTLFVTATDDFTADDFIVIDPDGDRQETAQVSVVNAGVSLTLAGNLTYTHTQAQGDSVKVAHKRCFFDFVWDGNANGFDALDRYCMTSRAFRVMQDGKVKIRPYKSETPTKIVCAGNIRKEGKETTRVHYPAQGQRPNRISMIYLDEDEDYRRMSASIEDPAGYTAGEKLIPVEQEIFGVTRRAQALREGYFRLKKARYTGKLIEFSMGIECLDFEPGDVFYFASDVANHGYGSGRCLSGAATSITLEHPVTIPSGTIDIYVQHADGTIETQELTDAAGTHKVLHVASWTSTPAALDKYIVGTPGQYRALSVKMDSDLRATIKAEQDSSAFYVDDFGTVPDFTVEDLPDPNEIPPDVTGLTATAANQAVAGRVQYALQVGWIKPEHNAFARAAVFSRSTAAEIISRHRSDFGPGTADGELALPRGVHCDGTHVYVADPKNSCIWKFLAVDLSFVAKLGSAGTGDGQVSDPRGVWSDGTHIWIADARNNRIQKWLIDGTFVDKLGSSGAGDDQFAMPSGIHGYGDYIVVADTGNHRIIKIDKVLDGSVGGTWTAVGSQGSGNDQFERPMGIATDGTSVLVADTANNRIKKHLFSDMTYSAKIGSSGTGDDNFILPEGCGMDSTGAIYYVADTGNHRIHRRVGSTLALTEIVGETGINQNGRGTFSYPSCVCHNDLYIYTVERGNCRLGKRDDEEAVSGGWEHHGDSREQEYVILDRSPGQDYEVAVVSKSAWDTAKSVDDAPSTEVYQAYRTTAPPNVSGLSAANFAGQVRLSWTEVNSVELAGYWIQVGSSELASTPASFVGTTYAVFSPPPAGQSRTYYVWAKTTSGIYSATAATVTYYTPTIPTFPTLPGGWGWNWRI